LKSPKGAPQTVLGGSLPGALGGIQSLVNRMGGIGFIPTVDFVRVNYGQADVITTNDVSLFGNNMEEGKVLDVEELEELAHFL
jgi:hypothetical protein